MTRKLNLSALRKQLEVRQTDLLRSIETTSEVRAPVELDQSMQGRLSRMDALQQREMALATQRRREIELNRIAAALRRMDKEDYGYCVSCDEDIAPGRLKSDPSEPLCVECAETVKP
ncbi:MAG: TraR/DksA family transcriptional regulator [Rhodospirillaceae bacterium]